MNLKNTYVLCLSNKERRSVLFFMDKLKLEPSDTIVRDWKDRVDPNIWIDEFGRYCTWNPLVGIPIGATKTVNYEQFKELINENI